MEQLFNQLTRPRLRGLLDDCYKDTTYLLDDDDYAEAEEGDLVRKRFQRAWEGLVDGYKVCLCLDPKHSGELRDRAEIVGYTHGS